MSIPLVAMRLTPPPGLSDIPAPLELQESARARRMLLRVDAARGVVRVIVPRGVGAAQALGFISRNAEWVRERVAALPAAMPFVPETVVPILGRDYRLCHDPEHRGAARIMDDRVVAGGPREHFARRIRDFLIATAKREFNARAPVQAARIGRKIAAISVRDQRTRWGSCSAAGRLAFSLARDYGAGIRGRLSCGA